MKYHVSSIKTQLIMYNDFFYKEFNVFYRIILMNFNNSFHIYNLFYVYIMYACMYMGFFPRNILNRICYKGDGLRGARVRRVRQPLRLRAHPARARPARARLPQRAGQPARVPALHVPAHEAAVVLLRGRDDLRPEAALPHAPQGLPAVRHRADQGRRQGSLM